MQGQRRQARKRVEPRASKHDMGQSYVLVKVRGRLRMDRRGGAKRKFAHDLFDLVGWIVRFFGMVQNKMSNEKDKN